MVLFEHRPVVVHECNAKTALPKGAPKSLACVFEVQIEGCSKDEPIHEKLGCIAASCGE